MDAMAYSIGNISGCHINPAVSIAMLVSGKMSVKDFVGYVVAQFLGAIAGAAILMGILGGTELGLGQNGLFEGSIVRSLIVFTCSFDGSDRLLIRCKRT